jgi:hypothetical protein
MGISRGEPVLDSTSWTHITGIYAILVASVCQSRLSIGVHNVIFLKHICYEIIMSF